MFCVPKELVQAFKEKLKTGEITPEKLADMASKERHAFLGEILGEANARSVNALFESKLLLKNQQLGIINWAKKIAGLKPEVLRDIVSRVNRMDKVLDPKEMDAFLEDLASQRLGFDVTFEEAAQISHLAKDIATKKEKISSDSPIRSPERLEYGLSLALFKDYVGKLKLGEKGWKEYVNHPIDTIFELAGVTKSMLSTLDNSFFGRQGIKTLYTNPTIWGKNFLKSWVDIGRELKGQDAMIPIKSDVYSRPNALNGKYERMKLDIGLATEEAFPSALPSKIPILGRVFKGAESAFNGAALRMRADLADRIIKIAEEQGINMLDKSEAVDIGKLVNSATGRGSIGKLDVLGKEINAAVFSIKFLKSNIDVLTQPFNRNLSPFVRKQAAYNLLKIAGGVAAINTLFNFLDPESTEFDPRSSGFMKPKIPGTSTRFDTTGGVASILTLASRLTPTKHGNTGGYFGNGWGFWSKNPVTRQFTDLTAGKYGQTTALDIFENFWEGKLSPLAGLVRDVWRGENFDKEKVTIQNALTNLALPLSIQQFQQIMNSPDSDKVLMLMIMEVLGLSTVTYTQKPKPIKF